MSQHDAVTIRCWQLTGETALEDMVLGVDERAVRDGINVLTSDDFDACLAIVVCRIGPNFYAHLSQVAGHYKGDASGIWDRSRGSGAPEGTAYEIKPLTRIHRVPGALIGPKSRLPRGHCCVPSGCCHALSARHGIGEEIRCRGFKPSPSSLIDLGSGSGEIWMA